MISRIWCIGSTSIVIMAGATGCVAVKLLAVAVAIPRGELLPPVSVVDPLSFYEEQPSSLVSICD